MACNKDSHCKTIADNYPSLLAPVEDSISKITGSISEISGGLGGLSIPDDYLGTKVKSRVQRICAYFEANSRQVSMLGSKISNFVSEKITEHNKHYNDWVEQERLARLEQQRRAQAKRKAEREQRITNSNRSSDEVA